VRLGDRLLAAVRLGGGELARVDFKRQRRGRRLLEQVEF
jgi:hypothetical protein